MRFVVVTGLSGAGKSTVLKMLEDARFFCVDNLPIQLLEKFVTIMPDIHGGDVKNIAIGIDIRSGKGLDELVEIIKILKSSGIDIEILFLEAEDRVLIKRYKETRRSHPLSNGDRVDIGINKERKAMETIKSKADYIIDTSNLLTRELREEIEKVVVNNEIFSNLMVSVVSFGFKYGVPVDADLIFDVRFLPNPFYVDELRPLTGVDDRVFNFVMDNEIAKEFIKKLIDMIEFLLPNYVKEGKTNLVIGIGCTGGRHRSVSIARELYRELKDLGQYGIRLEHRDTMR